MILMMMVIMMMIMLMIVKFSSSICIPTYIHAFILPYSSSIESLKTLQRLHLLDVRGNKLSSLQSLQAIASMPSLSKLFICGNSIERSVDYPLTVFRLQDNLQLIDDW